jgi:trans-aconitate methyltransferase
MNTLKPIDLLFAGMDKLSPGDDSLSLYVLRSLPEHRFEAVVDAGCGAGRQTFVLADELKTPIDAVDSYQPFLESPQTARQRKRGCSTGAHALHGYERHSECLSNN